VPPAAWSVDDRGRKETGLTAAGYNADVAAGVDRGRTAAALTAGGDKDAAT